MRDLSILPCIWQQHLNGFCTFVCMERYSDNLIIHKTFRKKKKTLLLSKGPMKHHCFHIVATFGKRLTASFVWILEYLAWTVFNTHFVTVASNQAEIHLIGMISSSEDIILQQFPITSVVYATAFIQCFHSVEVLLSKMASGRRNFETTETTRSFAF